MPHSRGSASARSLPGPCTKAPSGAGEVLSSLSALAVLCATQNCSEPVSVILLQGFTGARGTGLSWKGLAGAISRQGSLSKIFLPWVRTHHSVAFRVSDTKAIINDPVQTKRTAVPVTFYSCLNSQKFFFLKLLVLHCLTFINFSSLLLEAKGVFLQGFTESAQLKWNVWWRIVELFWLRFGNDKKTLFWEQKNTWFSHFSPT